MTSPGETFILSTVVGVFISVKERRRCLNPKWSWWWQEMILAIVRGGIRGLWIVLKLVGSPMSLCWSMHSRRSMQQIWPKGTEVGLHNGSYIIWSMINLIKNELDWWLQICLYFYVNRYDIPIGLHANLSEGLPVSQKLTGSTLLNKDGFFHGKMGFREVLQSGQLKMSEVNRDTTHSYMPNLKTNESLLRLASIWQCLLKKQNCS